MRHVLAAAALGLVLALTSSPITAVAQGATGQPGTSAQAAQPAQPDTKPARRRSRKAAAAEAGEAPAKKQPSAKAKAQRDRMRTCAAEWKASGQKGKAAHNAFMKECLKKKTS